MKIDQKRRIINLFWSRILMLTTFGIFPSTLYSQSGFRSSVSLQSVIKDAAQAPFWLTHNEQGIFENKSSDFLLLSGEITRNYSVAEKQKFDYEVGLKLVGNIASEQYFQMNQAYAGVRFKIFKVKFGAFSDDIILDGLSTTNGDLCRSINTRPYPLIRISTNEFIPFLFWKSWFSFKAEYDEGILNDNRWVSSAHLHHKSIDLRISLKHDIKLTASLNHYVFWGGTSPDFGQLPNKMSDYPKYILAQQGGAGFNPSDSIYIAGNQLGTYKFTAEKVFKSGKAIFYVSHPFEDKSGVEWTNWRDNLIGLYFSRSKENSILKSILYEFTFTKHQSGAYHLSKPDANGRLRGTGLDNYYNHGTYRSGFTYFNQTLCSPLFSDLKIENGKIKDIRNTRFIAHHIGMTGIVNSFITWRALATYSLNYGTYNTPDVLYKKGKHQFSSLLDVGISPSKIPFTIGVKVAFDKGSLYKNSYGANLSLSKSW